LKAIAITLKQKLDESDRNIESIKRKTNEDLSSYYAENCFKISVFDTIACENIELYRSEVCIF
jgi:hypothetical protein